MTPHEALRKQEAYDNYLSGNYEVQVTVSLRPTASNRPFGDYQSSLVFYVDKFKDFDEKYLGLILAEQIKAAGARYALDPTRKE